MTEYEDEEFIGSGGFSNVYRVRIENQIFALKKIHPYLLKDPTIKSAIMKQVEIMKQINHPNIVKFHSCIQSHQCEVNLVLELIQGGNLYSELKIHQRFTEQKTVKYIKDILKAVKYLHSKPNPILHRDIKPENILLTKSGECKLADFGSSNLLDGQRNTFAGTQQYMAPQIVDNQPYGKQVDLWCLGILIHELLLGYLPKQTEVLSFPSKLSRAAQDVIKRLLNKNPSLRMTLQELQNHIWLAQPSQCSPIFSINTTNSQTPTNMNQLASTKQRLQNIKRKMQEQKANKTKSQVKTIETTNNPQSYQILSKQQQTSRQQQYLDEIRWKCQLKIKLNSCKQQITRTVKLPELKRLREQYLAEQIEKIKQIKKSTQKMQSNNPLKVHYEYEKAINSLIKKLQHLSQYVEYFPEKLVEQTTEMPQTIAQQNINAIQIDNYIMKLKSYALLVQRDSLVELIAAKRKLTSFQNSQ